MNILIFNNIARKGLDLFKPLYNVSNDLQKPLGILLRSHNLINDEVCESVLGIARCGSGVNNIPIKDMTNRGIVVFNTPGANANSVKELTLNSLLLASRGICEGIDYVKNTDNPDIENIKKQYKGHEIYGKTLGIIGLGNIGRRVGDAAHSLGMNILGYDPHLSLDEVWKIPGNKIHKVSYLDEVLSRTDYLTLHVPFIKETENMINKTNMDLLKKNVNIINMSRNGLIDENELLKRYKSKELTGKYITDFYNKIFTNCSNVLTMPHLGASTHEAEENSAIMAANQMIDFIEKGNIKNSVNLPDINLYKDSNTIRLTIINKNNPGVISYITDIFSSYNINIQQQVNKSQDGIAYNIFDLESFPNNKKELLEKLDNNNDIIKVRIIS